MLKRCRLSILITLIAFVSMFDLNSKENNISVLWEKYEAAAKLDQPKKQADILVEIKTLSKKEGKACDFYRAGSELINVRSRRNWKLRESERKAFFEELNEFGSPILPVLYMLHIDTDKDAALEYVKGNVDALKALRNEEIYDRYAPSLYDNSNATTFSFRKFVRNDYEFVLWSLLDSYSSINLAVEPMLRQEVEGAYPQIQYLDYHLAAMARDEEKMHSLVESFKGTAMSLYPESWLLQRNFDSIERMSGPKASSPDLVETEAKNIYSSAKDIHNRTIALRGNEKAVVNNLRTAKRIMECLNDKDLEIHVKDKSIVVGFRNMDKAEVVVKTADKPVKTMFRKSVKNPQKRFYVFDTVTIDMPLLDDGDYILTVQNGKIEGRGNYSQYSLSIAVRSDAKGFSAYVADYKSGEPLENVTLKEKNKSYKLDLYGFTYFCGGKSTEDIYAESTYPDGRKRLSPSTWAYSSNVMTGKINYSERAYIYKDKSAYKPGETLRFKVVAFLPASNGGTKVLPEGTSLNAVLYDSEGNEISKKGLCLNAYGSASSEFNIPTGCRNGRFRIALDLGDSTIGSDVFIVDEFTLPSFDLTFEKDNSIYQAGDAVTVRGKIESYSGHPLSAANIHACVERWGNIIAQPEVTLESDGHFALTFVAEQNGWHSVILVVENANGETLNFATGVIISSYFDVSASLVNADDASVVLEDGSYVKSISSDNAELKVRLYANGHDVEGQEIAYSVIASDGVSVLTSGKVLSGSVLNIETPSSEPSAKYVVKFKWRDEEDSLKFVKIRPDATSLDFGVKQYFYAPSLNVNEGEDIVLRMGGSCGDIYAVATLYDNGLNVLENRVFKFDGSKGSGESLQTLNFEFKKEYSVETRLVVFYFLDGGEYMFDKVFTKKPAESKMELRFERFLDSVLPAKEYRFSLVGEPGAEVLAGIWDKSMDAISVNSWREYSAPYTSVPSLYINVSCGEISGSGVEILREEAVTYGTRSLKLCSADVGEICYDAMPAPEMSLMANDMEDSVEMEESEEAANVQLRSDFETALCFEPFLRFDANGLAEFSFRTSDKLSTFHVAAFSHDKSMRNALVMKDFQVTIPVQVSVYEPSFLFKGDSYDLAVALSSIADNDVEGKLTCYIYKGSMDGELLSSKSLKCVIPSNGQISKQFKVEIPDGVEELGFKIVFESASFSDAVFVKVPVYEPVQHLQEAHSALLLKNSDYDAVLDSLKACFVNVDPSKCTVSRKSVFDMVLEALPSKIETSKKDVISLTETILSRALARYAYTRPLALLSTDNSYPKQLSVEMSDEELLSNLLSCRNADGGFAWFANMRSSYLLTALVLERFHRISELGFDVPDLTASVKYLDTRFTSTEFFNYIGNAQYAYIRSLYAQVPFDEKVARQADKKEYKEFSKSLNGYLVPKDSDGRGLQGQILAKALRIRTLENLSNTLEGRALAKAWGLSSPSEMRRSIELDKTSIKEYAVEHRKGAWYFPNAVLPWRGLLESEAYAHAFLANELDRYDSSCENIADGVRLWMMIQKETQQWSSDPGFVESLAAILSGDDDLLSVEVLSLSAEYDVDIASVKASGNEMSLQREFYRESVGKEKLVRIKDGDVLRRGEKIIVKYNIYSEENRSFVRLTAPHEACLRPVNQLSGMFWGYSWGTYREVHPDSIVYMMEVCPEDKTSLTDEFVVTATGIFHSKASTIESLYAPHYRANTASPSAVVSRLR